MKTPLWVVIEQPGFRQIFQFSNKGRVSRFFGFLRKWRA